MTFLYLLAIFAFLFLCVVLCGVILIQEGQAGGLGASFGGDVSDSIFGTSTADVLKKFTAYLALAFILSCLVLNIWTEVAGRTTKTANPYTIEQLED